MITLPKDNDKYKWTNHVKDKMIYYRISESLVKRIVRFPKRKEEGIAPGTTAVMQSAGGRKSKHEIWVMYQEIGLRPISGLKSEDKSQRPEKSLSLDFSFSTAKKRIISAWRYPGISPVGKPIPIPDEILQELENIL